jgi:hypothetical protein
MRERSLSRGHARAAFLLSFSSFFIYPAIPISANTGLGLPSLLAGALAFMWVGQICCSDWAPFAWMMAPLVLSASFVLLAGTAIAPDVALKSVAALGMAFVVVVPTGYLLRTGHGEPFLHGTACAIIVQSALGAYQAFEFERSRFPFAELMRTSPGLAMTPETIDTYVEYVKRPFGLFPEPSAMAACLGPWLALIAVALFTPTVQERFRRHRTLLMVALASGLGLVALSKSGQALPIAAATSLCAVLPAFTWRGRPAARAAALLAGLAIVGGTAAWINSGAASRFEFDQNGSWQARLASLDVAIQSLTRMDSRFFFGIGPGQTTWELRSAAMSGVAASGITAVWSGTLMYAMETGVFGLVCMLVLGRAIARSIWTSSAPAGGAACAAVWLFGITFGTSCVVLPPLWTAMAALLTWRSVLGTSEPDFGFTPGTEREEAAFELRASPLSDTAVGARGGAHS